MYSFSRFFLLFVIYSVIGYIIEVIVCSIERKKIILNRGFLIGPYLPIFGVGALAMILLLAKYQDDLWVLFFLGMLICSSLEYLTGWILEKWFHNKWWDYFNHFGNINGRITIVNSVAFGLTAILIVKYINPLLESFINYLASTTVIVVGLVLLAIMLVDEYFSLVIAYASRKRIIIVEELKAEKIAMVPDLIKKYINDRIGKLKNTSDRLMKSFPKLVNKKEIMLVKEVIIELKKERKTRKKNR